METYTLVEEDVQAYLDSKQDDDVIGVTYHENACLLVNAFRFKYPQAQAVSCYFGKVFADGTSFQLSEQMHHVYLAFDKAKIVSGKDYVQVTKREWLRVRALEGEARS